MLSNTQIKDIRLLVGTQMKFANELGVCLSVVYLWETGKHIPQPQMMERIKKVGEKYGYNV